MNFLTKNLLYISWATALAATAGSLYFQYVLNLSPCILCWYQRIAMYPLVIILGLGIIKRDAGVFKYAIPFSLIGLLIAIYHNLLYYHIIPESIAPCVQGISCTIRQIEWLGFITIPLLSLMAFGLITVCLITYRRINHE